MALVFFGLSEDLINLNFDMERLFWEMRFLLFGFLKPHLGLG